MNLVLTTQRWTKLVAGRGIPFSDGDFCAARRRHKMDQLRPATNIRSRERQLDCCESALPQWCAVSLCRPVCLVPLSRGKPLWLTANPPRAVLQCARDLTLLLSITPSPNPGPGPQTPSTSEHPPPRLLTIPLTTTLDPDTRTLWTPDQVAVPTND